MSLVEGSQGCFHPQLCLFRRARVLGKPSERLAVCLAWPRGAYPASFGVLVDASLGRNEVGFLHGRVSFEGE